MILTFEAYQAAGGKMITDSATFASREPMAERLIAAYIRSRIPFWRTENKLENYGRLSLKGVILDQIDYAEAHGGEDAYMGNSDLSLKSVSTSGFNYSMDGKSVPMFNNIPLSPLAKADLDSQLLLEGYGGRAIW